MARGRRGRAPLGRRTFSETLAVPTPSRCTGAVERKRASTAQLIEDIDLFRDADSALCTLILYLRSSARCIISLPIVARPKAAEYSSASQEAATVTVAPSQPAGARYIPVSTYKRSATGATMRDTLAPESSLAACKTALVKKARPTTGQFAGFALQEKARIEEVPFAGQKKIVVE